VGIPREEFRAAFGRNFSLAPVASNHIGEITAVTVTVQGKRGCRSTVHCNEPVDYRLFIELSGIRGSVLPAVWVLSPPDERIQHVNIWPARSQHLCPLLGKAYPYLCWGTSDAAWARAPVAGRTLINLLEIVGQHLSNMNYGSPARA
jgi:hypothetical protein